MHKFHSYCISASGEERGDGDFDARFPYWSFTKTTTAICALKLSENGFVDLDCCIDGAAYTLRQLLNHTAGLPDYGALKAYHDAVAAGEQPWSREKLLSAALAKGMLFAPGEGWSYSNVGYMLAREHIEAASGLDFAQLVADIITTPLGLTSVSQVTTREQFAELHCEAAGKYHPGWVYHGCLAGNVRDAARLLHGLFTGKLLSPASLAEMRVAYPLGGALEGRPWTACGYALGLMSGAMGKAGAAAGHSGGGPSCVNAVYHFPDLSEPVTGACFTDGYYEGEAETELGRLVQNFA
ncbi:D-alanyl-D-alanine carboxypeptidase [Rahnella aquatilis CIP 78.65 = ATCC 33071]|uniref:Penicillin-binding protein, beta-lactamase class C n=1 Tax=Rahnella aquatilis (strain ATCC 33071 / DSM 4594 / JCM 1683 / NBRC 105701 / NCIMB 13365 / CIP 78.65) TaxID=745277 RepID=H2J203_RAHAC|nr:serine hydrolase domain-containing protein [Rahnella aquatilis]AEX54600.1 penicillin-binding protein, beta-lactamase class C [Rahnella aquatilis CIP 78.65 = ATCC 33071]KFD00199.1 D-alanyl-D-alanine carboxypeptidase [Rahnella aquatilis CIP 78.65 = ATCC 33071]